jgi:SAM-dependent methyltransferase
MDLTQLQEHWDRFGRTDPLWAVLTDPTKKGNRWNVAEFFGTGKTDVDDLMAQARRIGVPERFRNALDFGCGVGRVTQALGTHFERCTGVDISPSMIARANAYNRRPDTCRYYVNSKDDLQRFPDNEFDLVYAGRVLQHIDPSYTRRYVGEFMRVLAIGGLASFDVPSEAGFFPQGPNASEAMSADAFRAQLRVEHPQETLLQAEPESMIVLAVQVTNVSNRVWDVYAHCPVKLGNHWLDSDGTVLVFDDQRVTLPGRFPPGEKTTLNLSVKAPSSAGDYTLRLDMVQEFVTWFEHLGSATLDLPIQVGGKGGKAPTGGHSTSSQPALGSSTPEAIMEMHALPRNEVEALIEHTGGAILDITEVYHCGPMWKTYKYAATKR